MKKLIVTSLALATLVNSSIASFALSASVKSDLCSATLKKSSTYPWDGKDMQAGCLGIIEVKIKNPGALMKNSEIQVKINEEPSHYFNSLMFFQKKPVRKEVNKFQLDGVRKKASWYNIPGRFLNWLLDKRVPVEYRIVPINKNEAQPFCAQIVNEGDKKAEAKINEGFIANVLKKNEKSKMAELAEKLIEKAVSGLSDPDVDKYDPYNVVEKGKIIKYADYKDKLDLTHYYSKKEAEDKNKQMALQRAKVCDGFVDKAESELKKYGLMATLSAEKPVQYFAIVVNNKIDDKPEAYKLFNLLASNGYNFLNDDKSVLEFTCQKVFKMPEGGKPANKEKLVEVEALINSTKEKPGMRQWFKNLSNLILNSIDTVTPQFISDAFRVVSSKFRKALDAMDKTGPKVSSKAPAALTGGATAEKTPVTPAGGSTGSTAMPAGEATTTAGKTPAAPAAPAAPASQPVINVNVVNMPVGQQKVDGNVNVLGDMAHDAAAAAQPQPQPGATLGAPEAP